MMGSGARAILFGLAAFWVAASVPRLCDAAERPIRVLAEVGGAGVGAVGGALAVGTLVWAVAPGGSQPSNCVSLCPDERDVWTFFGAAVGSVVGLGSGVYGAGRLTGGEGAYWAAMAGESAGLAADAALWGLFKLCDENGVDFCSDSLKPAAAVGLILLPLAGSITGYEWSSTLRSRRGAQGTAMSYLLQVGWFQAF